ncbi:MAG: hypothetical protein A2806_00660 [Candidatus Terrybacteria bacterium RIFCSPHIGHO2_01_FULL_48_17]|uniref:Ribose-5-phosphate isomerase n=1 Tax=Candidatus Terrybacteria bacterium RIFCSPHIGHO2_01_FULL_48_17 TaxID=1802362 RepID=A0A1G2PIG8_9BACT|nr:MAG: hypothetical protein A2806_00660 [Candidatus Terrybacteria bacterium RIFCSPHIGHO2_01_FULL_48_17]OHA53852.1 MAG: hypothetical protein A3A30_01260 [Candidatus Terrybacteria bacterium RIFCSPLOWO2_01_FULL_48_14]
MKIYLAADHNGFALKEKIKKWLNAWEYEYEDIGPFVFDPKDDYPDFIIPAARAVAQDPDTRRAIILGFSGQAEAMTANRMKNVRASVYYGEPSALSDVGGKRTDKPRDLLVLTREDNDSNILSLGAGFLSEKQVKEAITRWLKAPFTGQERHIRRINKIDQGIGNRE